jgi:alpha-ketoglutarate-dependent taurine dioxygenase
MRSIGGNMKGFKTSFVNKVQLPLVIQPSHEMSKREFFESLSSQHLSIKRELLKYGGILLRGFPIETIDDFSATIRHLNTGSTVDYIGGDSPRNKIKDGIYTSTEAPPSIKILLHHELSFVKHHPKHIYFFCEIPPVVGGATIIADARKVYNSLNPFVRRRFIDKGLRYESCYYHKSLVMETINKLQPSHKSWIQVFETDSKPEVEKKCLDNEFQWEWTKNGWLRIKQERPAVKVHPQTGEIVWFNQSHLYDFNPRLLGIWRYIAAQVFYYRKYTKLHQISFADDTPIPRSDLYHIMDVLDQHTLAVPWKKGDVLLLDNILTMHGRETFEGKRRILTAMTS